MVIDVLLFIINKNISKVAFAGPTQIIKTE